MTNVKLLQKDAITLDRFWDIANDLFHSDRQIDELGDGCTEDKVNSLLVNYLTLVCEHCDQLTTPDTEEQFYNDISEYVTCHRYYRSNMQFCVRKMLSLLTYSVGCNESNLGLESDMLDNVTREQVNESITVNEKLIRIIGWILIVNYQSDKDALLQILKDFNGFETLAGVLSNYSRISRNSNDKDPYIANYSPYFELFYELCKNYEFDSTELDHVHSQLLEYLFESLEVVPKENNILNFMKFKLLLVLNEQFMVSQFSSTADSSYQIENRFFIKMTEDSQRFQNFNEVLILNFNREQDHVIQILMLKVLYLVFTTSHTCGKFYINDLKLIIDIMIRELFNLSTVREEALINTYLRVLYPMILFSSIKEEGYKRESISEVLRYLVGAEQTSETTKRLAERCLVLDYFSDRYGSPLITRNPAPYILSRENSSQSSVVSEIDSPDSPTAPIDRSRSNSSVSSQDSKGLHRKRPPPPPPRRYNQRNGSELMLSRTKVANK
ncbi:hypothetical protein KL937_001111 [Ogataea polymorpha]|nr:hypothetical protein KL937_001111 [Ogataea polymorpha]KAG7938578.1 hypothetical protein KL904_001107 [Ogataea polymorpha]